MTSHAYNSIIHLCLNEDNDSESELIEQLRIILDTNSDAVHHRHKIGHMSHDHITLLHYAINEERSFNFCKLLIDQNSELVKTPGNNGDLPIHLACEIGNNIELIKYLIHQYPESINISDSERFCPIHIYLLENEKPELDVLQFLLKHDRGAVSKPDRDGNLPLHLALIRGEFGTEENVFELFNAYPEAIFIENGLGRKPLDIAQGGSPYYSECRLDYSVAEFLEFQLDLEYQARHVTTPDVNGELPIHIALQRRNAPLGTTKLMVAANPTSLSVADHYGLIPLHIESYYGNLDVVKFLVEKNRTTLVACDLIGNYPLHQACRGGNCAVISYILAQTTQGASLRNSDGKLPIEILLYEGGDLYDFDSDGLRRYTHEYTEAVYHLLCAHPHAVAELAESIEQHEYI